MKRLSGRGYGVAVKEAESRCLQPVAGSFYLNSRRKFKESDKGTWLNI